MHLNYTPHVSVENIAQNILYSKTEKVSQNQIAISRLLDMLELSFFLAERSKSALSNEFIYGSKGGF